MNNYRNTFNKIANDQEAFCEGIKLWEPIDISKNCDTDKVLLTIRKAVKLLGIVPVEMIGKCFNIVMATSIALIKEGIRHTVTIGNVCVENKPYFNTTMESILEDLEAGYLPEKPEDAHAWITLEDGTIIDLTILSSIAYKNKRKPLKLIKAIYVSKDKTDKISHIPFFLGPMYIVKTCIDPNDASYPIVCKWLTEIYDLLNSTNCRKNITN